MAGGSVGYSNRINDPAFARYNKNANQWAAIFSVVLALVVIIGFYIYGESSSEMDNPQALYIGLGIGGMFLLIAVFTILSRGRGKTWDGIVVDKTIEYKSRTRGSDDDEYEEQYTKYTVIFQDHAGKRHELVVEDDDTLYHYFRIGEHVRHHGALKTYEKYDKSRDNIIFCNACATLCDIYEDYCPRCKCPLLK